MATAAHDMGCCQSSPRATDQQRSSLLRAECEDIQCEHSWTVECDCLERQAAAHCSRELARLHKQVTWASPLTQTISILPYYRPLTRGDSKRATLYHTVGHFC
jgi:hypothetical protein